jgi:hypothetical protein
MYRHHTIVCPQCRLPHEILDYHCIPKNYTVIEFVNYVHLTSSLSSSSLSPHSSPSHLLENEIHCLDGEIPSRSFSSSSSSHDLTVATRKSLDELTVEEVSRLLTKLKLSKFIEIFAENEIDGLTLSHCRDEQDLLDAGINIKVKARFLFEKLQSYQVLGVPIASIADLPTRDEGEAVKSELEIEDEGVSLWIVGMKGIYEFMNGLYYPTEEVWMGRRRYYKMQHDCWIEYNSDYHQWHIKPQEKKTTTNAWAYISALPSMKYPYEAALTSSWHLYDSLTFVQHENIYCFPHFSIYLAGISFESQIDIDVGVGEGDTLNGYYEPVPQDLCGGICRYRQRSYGFFASSESVSPRQSHSRAWLEYSLSTRQWQLKYEEDLNTNKSLLFVSSLNPREIWSQVLPWLISPSHSASSSISPLSTNTILSLPKLCSLELVGGNGPTAAHIRGVYQPSREVFGGWVRYHKITDHNCWLEKMESQKQWHVKPTKDKSKTNAWACIKYTRDVPPYLLHEEGWLIYDGSVFLDDPSLKCVKKLPLI